MDDQRLVKVLKALADAKRFRMVQEIAAAGELSCGKLGERFDLSQPAISHHLKILSEAGVSVNQPTLDQLTDLLPGRLAKPRKARK